jgi:hypothetical protein
MSDNDRYNYVTTGNVKLLPADASPADVMDTEEGWRISTHLQTQTKTEQKQEITVLYRDKFINSTIQTIYMN